MLHTECLERYAITGKPEVSVSSETECEMTDDGHREMQVSGLLPDSNELVFFCLPLSLSVCLSLFIFRYPDIFLPS
jgi:hypothetical protein